MPLLLHFGAGNIGRSLVGQLFSKAGWEVAFVDVDDRLVDALNTQHGYDVVVKDEILPGWPDRIRVDNVRGIRASDNNVIAAEIGRADLLGMSVGAGGLKAVLPLVARALTKRHTPVSLMLCENLHSPAEFATGILAANLPSGFPLRERLGIIGAAISKMVPATPPEVRSVNPLEVWAEAYNTLYLDRDGYIGAPPNVPGVAWRSNFDAYVDRKLLIHNFGHAATAYHGFLHGKTYIWECMENPEVRAETRGCMLEVCEGLARKHSAVFTFDELKAWTDDLLHRFHNPALADPVFRVGRDLKRKLAPGDRCLGALRLLEETGVAAVHTPRAIAAALLFQARDESGVQPEADREVVDAAAANLDKALEKYAGLNPAKDRKLIDDIAYTYKVLAKRG